MPTRRDKTTGLPLPSPVVPATTLCFKMTIPNALEYRTALKGILSDLGRAWTWSQTVGEDNNDAHEAAALWRKAIAEATFDLDCEGDMSCTDVANCIGTDAATQAAIAAQVSSSGPAATNIYNTSYVGAPMTPAQRVTPVSVSEDCDLDELFGSITSIVDQLDTNNRDFLEVIQLTDNAQQRISKIIKAIPLLNEVPIDEALDFASQLSIEIKENYDAEYTSALRDTYRCAIFCLAKDKPECEVTFQELVEYFNNRIGTSLEPVNFFVALVQYFTSGTWAGTTVVDIMTLIQLSAWQQASNWIGISLRTLQTVGLLGANDPDPDWMLLCEDCPPPAIMVPATATPPDGFDTGINLVEGVEYTISATGTWNGGEGAVGPEGSTNPYGDILVLNGPTIYNLIAKIGTGGSWFAVGAGITFTADASGRLLMLMNDGNSPAYYVDNSGSVTVTVAT